MTREDQALLDELARLAGNGSASAVIRRLIREEANRLGIVVKKEG